jgi:hypothetical protein
MITLNEKIQDVAEAMYNRNPEYNSIGRIREWCHFPPESPLRIYYQRIAEEVLEVACVREMMARIEQLEDLLFGVIKDYQGLEVAAENNNLVKTAGDARDTIAHIIKILNTKPEAA